MASVSRKPPDRSSLERLVETQSVLKLVSVVVVAAAAGMFSAWATVAFSVELLNLHIAIWTFLVVWAALVGYFAYLQVPSTVVGSGFYIIGLSIVVKPPLTFISTVNGDSASQALLMTRIQTVSELFISLLVFGVIGLIVIGLGAYFRRRGERKLSREMRATLRSWN